MAEKRCSKCKILKDIKDFHKDKSKHDGRNSCCKPCKHKPSLPQNVIPKVEKVKKILCDRNGQMISKGNCVPGCNDACMICENPQMQNIKASRNTLTPEEHKEQTLSGTYRSSALIAVED